MRVATPFELQVWRLRQAGLGYNDIAAKVDSTKNLVDHALRRIKRGEVTLPPATSRPGCRWVHGDPKQPGWHWCDEPVVANEAWCANHLVRVYRKPVKNDDVVTDAPAI